MNAIDRDPRDTLAAIFGVVLAPRTYLHVLYLLVALPLGVFYFCFLSIGLTAGAALLIVWVGLLLLAVVLLGGWGLALFERQQAIWLLGARIGSMAPPPGEPVAGWEKAKAFLALPSTWTGPLFLLLKFPLGIVSFVLTVVGLSISVALLLAPLYYQWESVDLLVPVMSWERGLDLWLDLWIVDTLPEAAICSVVGFLALVLTFHCINGVAWLWRELAQALLGGHLEGEDPAPAD